MEPVASSMEHRKPLGSDILVTDSKTEHYDKVIEQEDSDNCTEGQILDAVKTEVDDEINDEDTNSNISDSSTKSRVASIESDLHKIDKIIHDILNYDKHNIKEHLTVKSIKTEPHNDDFNSLSDNYDLTKTKTDAFCVKNGVDDIQGSINDEGSTNNEMHFDQDAVTKVEIDDEGNLTIFNFENSNIASSGRNNDVLESNEKQRQETPSAIETKVTKRSKCSNTNAAKDKPSCDICGYTTKKLKLFLKHLTAHAKGKLKLFTCDSCDYITVLKRQFSVHVRTHIGNKIYCCDICNKEITSRSSFLRHIGLHTGNRAYSCDVCDKTFSEKGTLRGHLRRHRGEKPFKCQICDKAFVESGKLLRHIRSHTGDKRHSCTICDKKFSEYYGLKIHMLVHTEERKISCEECLKMFKSKRTLRRHMKYTHADVRAKRSLTMFACDVCGKVMQCRTSLVNHLKTHSNEKPFLCTICKKSFGYKGGLQKHLKIHFARETVKCHACNKSFIERNNLVKHLKLYCHGEKVNDE